MIFKQTGISGTWVIEPSFISDDRGQFFRAWCAQEFAENNINFVPIQANMGYSIRKGTLRGLHYQTEAAPEAKLVRCTRGAIFDVAVDLRATSPTYLKWFGIELTPENGRMLYIPQLCAHGYETLEDETEMYYMTSHVYAPGFARGVRFDESAFAIEWPIVPSVMSDQDRNWPTFELA